MMMLENFLYSFLSKLIILPQKSTVVLVAFPFFLCVCLCVSFDEVDSGMNLPICILTASLEALILDSVWQHTVVISLRKLQLNQTKFLPSGY